MWLSVPSLLSNHPVWLTSDRWTVPTVGLSRQWPHDPTMDLATTVPLDLPLEVQCAIAERKAKTRVVPIYGLQGARYEHPLGGDATPGPMVWHQNSSSFRTSLDGSGKSRLLEATKGIGEHACPGEGVTFMRVSGSHGAGSGDGIPPQSPVREQRITFACSQSSQAATLKRGHNGDRSKAASVAVAASAGERPAKKKRKATVPFSSCGAKFVVAMRNEQSRPAQCSICGVFVRHSPDAPPDPAPFPTEKVGGVCPWTANHTVGKVHVVQSGFRVVKAATCHAGHWKRSQPLVQRVSDEVAQDIAALRSVGVSTAAAAAVHAAQTGGLLSSGQARDVIRRVSSNGGKDTGLPGLLDHFEGRGDVMHMVRWVVVLKANVHSDHSVVAGFRVSSMRVRPVCVCMLRETVGWLEENRTEGGI